MIPDSYATRTESRFPTRALATSLRPHQWVKNSLVFGGLIFSQSLFEAHAMMLSVRAFLTFCFAASAVYLFNDLRDLNEDRRHPTKRLRPLAAGEISAALVATAMLCLAVGSIGFAYLIRPSFGIIISIYLAMNVAYSVQLKHVVILDVMIIAIGFVLRAVAGAVAVGVDASPWLILCTLTLALLVGFGKRRNELTLLRDDATRHRACLESYSLQFLDVMMTISAGSAIVTYALYTMAAQTIARFGTQGLVITTPFVIYGIFRYLFLVHQESRGGDPSKLFVKDRPILANGILWVATACCVIYGPPGWLPW